MPFNLAALMRGPVEGYINSRYPNWNLDAALRYLPIAAHLNRSNPSRVLDVGSGGVGLSRYWGRPTIGLDFSLPASGEETLTCPVRGSGMALPFRDRSIDAVVCADVLEHIPPEDRPLALSELIRVADKELIVAVPCGIRSHEAEVALEKIFKEKTGESHPWLREHIANGLPEAAAMEDKIRALATKQGRALHLKVTKNMNLWLWYRLFRLYFGGGPRTSQFIRYYLLALLPFLRRINWGQTYRRIFYVNLDRP